MNDPHKPPRPNAGLGEVPAELLGQAPGLIGAPDARAYGEAHPPGYPALPPPPPPPDVDPRWLETQARIYAQILIGLTKDRYIQDMIATLTQSWGRQWWRPVAPPPWHRAPFRAEPLGGVSAYIGTTIPSGASTWTTIVSDTVPIGYQGAIRWVGHAVGDADDWAQVSWRLVHGPSTGSLRPYRTPFASWQHQIGQIEAPAEVDAIIVPEGHIVALQASQASGSEIEGIMGLLRGWLWPRTGGVTDGAGGSIVT